MWRALRYRLGLDNERKVPRTVDEFTTRMIVIREFEAVYQCHDPEDGGGCHGSYAEDVIGDESGMKLVSLLEDAWTGAMKQTKAKGPNTGGPIMVLPDADQEEAERRKEQEETWLYEMEYESVMSPDNPYRQATEDRMLKTILPVEESLQDDALVRDIKASLGISTEPRNQIVWVDPTQWVVDEPDGEESEVGTDGGNASEGGSSAAQKPTTREPVLSNPGERSRMVRAASAAARVKVGFPNATEANRLVVGRLVRDYMVERGVRPTHIQCLAPLATALCFIPTQADVEARQMLASSYAVQMFEEERTKYWSWGAVRWLRPSTWLGRAYAPQFAK